MDYSIIELELPRACVLDCSQSGDVSEEIQYWLTKPAIAAQFEEKTGIENSGLSLVDTARILYGYGAWELSQLADRDANIQRLLWLACCDAAEDYEQHPLSPVSLVFLEGHGYTEELRDL